MANEDLASWTDLLHSSTKLLEQAAPSAQFPPLQRNLDQLEALSKKLKSKTARAKSPSQSIAATRLLAREGINAEQLARDLKSFELKTTFEDVFPVEATSVEDYLQQAPKSSAVPLPTAEPAHDIPPAPSTPRAPLMKVSDKELSKYFTSADPLPMVSSTISNHLERVNSALMGEIPTSRDQVAALRTSLFKLANSADIPAASRELYNNIALHLNDLAHKYGRSKEIYDIASFDLKRLRELQEKKSQFQASYQTLEAEHQEALAQRKAIDDRLAVLTAELDRIKKEMGELAPKSTALTQKLESFSDQHLALYSQSTSLDSEIVVLFSQKAGLENDLKTGSDGLAEANKTWDSLKQQLEEAKRTETPAAADTKKVNIMFT